MKMVPHRELLVARAIFEIAALSSQAPVILLRMV